MSNDLVVLNNQNAVELPAQQHIEDMTGIDSFASKPGNIVLIQPTTINTYGGKSGQFLDTFDNSVYDKITVVPLRISRARVYFPEGETSSKTPLCGSNDGLVPRSNIQAPISRQCGYFAGPRFIPKCPKAAWGADGKRPACADQRRMFCIIKDTGLPAFMTISGLSVKSFETGINNIKKTRAQLRTAKDNPVNLELYDFYFTLTSQKAQGRPTYYLELADIRRVANPGQYYEFYKTFVVDYKAAADESDAFNENESMANDAVSQVIDAEFVEPLQAA